MRPTLCGRGGGAAFAALAVAGVLAWTLPSDAAAQLRKGELRCGWFDNSSPGNASLHDKDGEWNVSVQGGHEAEGDWPPKFTAGQAVRHGSGSYGYGCACLRVDVDATESRITRIHSSNGRPLSICRRDKALKDIENRLR